MNYRLCLVLLTCLIPLCESSYASRCFKSLPKSPIDPVVVDGSCNPKPSKTGSFSNAEAAEIHQVDVVRDTYGLDGRGVKVAIWDYKHVYKDHQEFREWDQNNSYSRVTIGDPRDSKEYSIHATHVAGTIGARGRDNAAIGIAPLSEISSYHYNSNILDEVNSAAASGVSISNHSHGFMMGWEGISIEDNQTILNDHGVDCNQLLWVESSARFGQYSTFSTSIDRILFNNPSMSAFFAAGNSRDTRSNSYGVKHCYWGVNGVYTPSTQKRPPNGLDLNEFGTINNYAVAKNVITIGASEDRDNQLLPTSFSSSGPTLDGRIKPDLVANGRDLWSTMPPTPCDDDPLSSCVYGFLSGSSMATPVATGIAALLNQQYNLIYQNSAKSYLNSYEMKATLINSARSQNGDGAPNFRVGWGVINALDAVNTIRDEKLRSFHIQKPSQTNFEKNFSWDNDNDLAQFTFTWLEPPSSMVERKAAFYIKSPSGVKHFPWYLDKDFPTLPAKRCVFSKLDSSSSACVRKYWDNVLKISLNPEDWEKGEWSIHGDLSRLKSINVFDFSMVSTSNVILSE